MTEPIQRKYPFRRDARLRFWDKVSVTPGGCWHWTSGKTIKGYGCFYLNGGQVLAHRYAYELMVGPIPVGRQIDHLCRTPGCVNPEHMEPVPPRENVIRGLSPELTAARHAKKRAERSMAA